VIKDDLGYTVQVDEVEAGNRIYSGFPTPGTPRLDDAFVWDEFDMTTRDVAAENRKGASGLVANLRWFLFEPHLLYGATQLNNCVELFRVGQRVVHPFSAPLEYGHLMDGFRRSRDFLLGRTTRAQC